MLGGCVLLLILVAAIRSEMEGHIVGGVFTSILLYPHSAFLNVACLSKDKEKAYWICGSSVVNQRILLTAGHCLFSCYSGTRVIINLGNEHKNKGIVRSSHSYVIHERYDPRATSNDIAMIRMYMPVNLQARVSRVALMRRPPIGEIAYVAGWGLTDENTNTQSINIKHIEQIIWSNTECLKHLNVLPKGTICGSSRNRDDYAAQGDSGSALVVRGYIQVGLVSYKVPSIAANIIIYTDVSYFYDWINLNAKRLFCHI